MIILGVLLVPLIPIFLFGLWLLATSDYDGGRQAVGAMIVVGGIVVAAVYASLYLLVRKRPRKTARST